MSNNVKFGLQLELKGDKVLVRGLDNARGSVTELSRKVGESRKPFRDLTGTLFSLKGALAGLGLGLAVRQISQVTDQYAQLEGRLRLVTNGTAELSLIQEQLFNIAQGTSSEFASVAELYTRTAQQADTLNASQQDLLKFVELTTKSFIVSGASQQEAAGATRQLTQALASGVLRGEEFNSVMEQGPRLMKALADGLGRGVGELRELAQSGEITADILFPALLSQAEKVNAEFQAMPRTIGRASTELENAFQRAIATTEVQPLIESIDSLKRTISDPGTVQGISTLTGAIIGGFAAAIEKASQLVNVVKFLAESTAAAINGPALGDLVRIQDAIAEKQSRLNLVMAGGGGRSVNANREGLIKSLQSQLTTLREMEAQTIALQKAEQAAKQTSTEHTVVIKNLASVGKGKTDAEKEKTAQLLEQLSLLQFQHRLLLQGMPLKEADNLVEEVSLRLKLAKQGLSQAEIQSYVDVTAAIREKTDAQQAELDLQKSVDAFLERDFSAPIEGFDQVSRAIVGAVDSLDNLVALQDEYGELRKAAAGDTDKLAAIEKKHQKEQIGLFGDVTASAKQFFDEGSSGYKALEKAEQAFRAVEIAMSVQALAVKLGLVETETAAVMAADGQKAISGGLANVAGSGTGLPFPANIAAMVATLAFLSSLGVDTKGGGAAGSIAGALDGSNLGGALATRGTVLGDPEAASKSIVNAIDRLEDIASDELALTSRMARALENIQIGLSGVGSAFAKAAAERGVQSLVISGRVGDAQAQITQGPTKFFDFQAELRRIAAFGAVSAAIEQGISSVFAELGSGIVAAVQALRGDSSAALAAFENIQLGNINIAESDNLDDALNGLFASLGDSAVAIVSGTLGLGIERLQLFGEGAAETLFRVAGGVDFARNAVEDLGISLAGLSTVASGTEDIGAELIRQSVLAAETFVSSFEVTFRTRFGRRTFTVFQNTLSGIGEIIRDFTGDADDIAELARGLFGLRDAMRFMGVESADVTRAMLNAAGGLDALADGLNTFRSEFFTDAERLVFTTRELTEELGGLGIALPATRDGFRALIESLDLANEAEQALFGSLLALVPLADEYFDSLESTASAIDGVSGSLNNLIGIAENLSDFLDRLSRTQGGTPIQQQQESLRQFREAGGLALSGDADAASSLQNLAQDLINSSRAAFASGSAFQAVMDEVRSTIQNVINSVGVPGAGSAAVPGFAVGGDHAGGIRLVGERGPELELTGPSRIFSADQTAAILRSGQDSSGVVVAINRHRAETEHQTRLQMSAQRQVVGQLRSLNRRVVDLESELSTARVTR